MKQDLGVTFPDVTVRDSVRLHIKLAKEGLGIEFITCVIGGSLGGMQALEWALECGPNYVGSIISLCCGAYHHAWQIGISETQRQAIYADPKWRGGNYPLNDTPKAGLAVARQIAMVTYRSHSAYNEKFGRLVVDTEQPGNGQKNYFDVERYLRYQVSSLLYFLDNNAQI
jgi:homoserine O-acetyltransferase